MQGKVGSCGNCALGDGKIKIVFAAAQYAKVFHSIQMRWVSEGISYVFEICFGLAISSCPYIGLPAFKPGEEVRLRVGDEGTI